MEKHATPRLVVSRCLGFEACRWNGVTVPDEFVDSLKPYVEYVTVCPEMEIGLGAPRDPIRAVSVSGKKRLMQPATGRDLTDEMASFTDRFLSDLPELDGFILKFRSPSCGIKKVKLYSSIEATGAVGETSGFFGWEVLRRFQNKAIEDEGRLLNQRIREHFLIRLFAYASFREMKDEKSVKALAGFHERNKLLYMAHSQKELKELGGIVAGAGKNDLSEALTEYERHFYQAFAKAASAKSNINVLMHALGYFKDELNKKEKAVFLDYLAKYMAGRVCLSTASGIVSSWIARFGEEYLGKQTFFAPYPEDLVQTGIPADRKNLKTSLN